MILLRVQGGGAAETEESRAPREGEKGQRITWVYFGCVCQVVVSPQEAQEREKQRRKTGKELSDIRQQ